MHIIGRLSGEDLGELKFVLNLLGSFSIYFGRSESYLNSIFHVVNFCNLNCQLFLLYSYTAMPVRNGTLTK